MARWPVLIRIKKIAAASTITEQTVAIDVVAVAEATATVRAADAVNRDYRHIFTSPCHFFTSLSLHPSFYFPF